MWDGREMLRRVNTDLLESSNSAFISDYVGYRYINEAALDWVIRTQSLRQTQAITTVADDDTYLLAPDFLFVYTSNNRGNKIIQYNNGSSNYFPVWKDYEDVIYQSSRTSTSIPGNFSVIDDPSSLTSISGTTTAAGASSNGECTLTNSGASFSSTVSIGDMVHNETDNSYGIVIEVTSNTALVTALFNGTNNDWSNLDSYVIVPQGRLRLVLDRPPSTSGHTITVYYVARPTPVFSPFRNFRIQSQYIPEILRDAKSKYELRGGDYNTGQADMGLYERKVVTRNVNYDKAFNRGKFSVRGRRGGH